MAKRKAVLHRERGGVLEIAKTKIELFEDALTADGMTGDSLPEYERLLKRAGNDWSRIQHCFLTAYRFPVERLEEAVQLIEFGISKYGSKPGYTIPAYEMLGTIYERAGCYQKAYDTYISIFPDIRGFKGNYPWCLLNMKMHVDRFTYSEKLEEYLALCLAEDAFSKAFLKNRFLLALADYIIAGHDGNMERRGNAYDAICEMTGSEFKGPLYGLLKRHRYQEELKITDECRAFLDRIER